MDFAGEVPDLVTSEAVVVKTIPEDMTLLKTIFQKQNFSAVYFKNDIDKAYYLTGYGTREQLQNCTRLSTSSQSLIFATN